MASPRPPPAMRLWQRVSGAVKDRNSIFQAALSSGSNPEIEKTVILCTSHTDLSIDRGSLHTLRHWLRLSPHNLGPLLAALSRRLSRTRNWAVALKGLYLVHTLVNSRLRCVASIGRLPFDLSDFNAAGGSTDAISCPFTQFVRSYYAFLDKKSVVVFLGGGAADAAAGGRDGESFLVRELAVLQNLQELINLLLQIKPQSGASFVPLILEVMDWIVIEIYDLYGMICRGIAIVLVNIYAGGTAEARLALSIVEKANRQGEEISEYFHCCRNLGVSCSAGFREIQLISGEGIRELEQIVNSFSDDELKGVDEFGSGGEGELETAIPEKWEKFDEEEKVSRNNEEEIPDFINL